MLYIDNVGKSFINNGISVDVLSNITFRVLSGEFFCLLGPSGSGKTTLLRCIGGYEKVTSGTIKLNNHTVSAPGIDRIMVFQGFDQLFAWKTVSGNIEYPLKVNGISRVERRERTEKYLSLVGLHNYANYYPFQLSGGMKQRTAIARALALEPPLLLMDEPFGNLDAITRHTLQRELLRIKDETNTTVLFVTHDIDEAITLGDRILIFSRQGTVKSQIENNLNRPRIPSMPGYASLWANIYETLGEG